MNDQNNPNGVENTFFPEQPTPNNITPEVPEMPALAAAPEATPTPVVVEEPAMPAPAPVVAPEMPAPAVAPVPEAPVVEPNPVPVMPETPVAPAPVVPEAPAIPVVPEAPIAPELPAQPVVAPAPVEVAQPAPQMAPAPAVAPVPPMPAPMQPAYAAAPVVAPVKQKTNGLCIAAIIFAFLMPLIGLILGIAGMSSAKKKGQKGKGLGIAAIIFSLLMPVIYVVAFIFLLGGALFGAVNGSNEAAVALQEGCASLDEYGDYESGYVTCEDYTCEYDDGTFTLSSSCNLIDTDDYEEEEEEEEPVTPAVTTITLPSTKWLFASDSSEIVFTETGFNWYKDENIYTDNYYTGTYKFYMGSEAAKYITEDLSSYGVTATELENLYSAADGKSEANLVVLVLSTTSMYIGGELTDLSATPIDAPYYGFAIKDGATLDLANMKSATYATLNKKAE